MNGCIEVSPYTLHQISVERAKCHVENDAIALLTETKPFAAQFEPTKLFHHADRIHQWLEGEIPVPITLELDLTLSCNDRCPFCPHAFAHQGRSLDVGSIRRVLDDAARLGILGLTITGGGEPLMHPEFQEVLRLIREYPFSSGIITNAGKMNSELASEMIATFDWIRVSLDAVTERTFQQVRGHHGLTRRLHRISLLADAKRKASQSNCEIGTSFLTSSEVANEIVQAARLSQELGFNYIQFKPMVHWLGINKNGSPLANQLGVVQALALAVEELQNETFKVLVTNHRYAGGEPHEDRSYSAFHSAWFLAVVGPNLSGEKVSPTLYLDCSSKYVPLWTIGEFDNLENILRSERRTQMIASASSDSYRIQSEKHATYNSLLDSVFRRHQQRSMSIAELAALATPDAKHFCSI